ncbi:hypothetical protein J6590_037786, partial [Homalodisca vitripennis]
YAPPPHKYEISLHKNPLLDVCYFLPERSISEQVGVSAVNLNKGVCLSYFYFSETDS